MKLAALSQAVTIVYILKEKIRTTIIPIEKILIYKVDKFTLQNMSCI